MLKGMFYQGFTDISSTCILISDAVLWSCINTNSRGNRQHYQTPPMSSYVEFPPVNFADDLYIILRIHKKLRLMVYA